MLIDWLWLVQTQSGQAGFQGRQLCIGAWTLLFPKPEVMVVPDCLTDFRYTESPSAANPTYATMHKAPSVLTVQPCCTIQLHQHSPLPGAHACNACVDLSSSSSCSMSTTSVFAVPHTCSPPSFYLQAATPPYGCQGAWTPLLRCSSPRSFQWLLRWMHVSHILIAVCTHACTVVALRLDITMYIHCCSMQLQLHNTCTAQGSRISRALQAIQS